MKFSIIATAIALATTVSARGAPSPRDVLSLGNARGAPSIEQRSSENARGAPVKLEKRLGCLNSFTAQVIVNKFISILENTTYNGQSPQTTANQIIADSYTEYSDSILSLEKAPLGDTPSATSKAQWVSEVTAHPEQGIQTLDILNSCNKIMWHWNFPSVGGGAYEVKGFNLLTVNFLGQITEADIEFNSIAWGLDTQQIYQYCPPPSS